MHPTSRRHFLKTTATGVTVAAIAGVPHVARAQTKLTLGLWDHWVPGANDVLRGIVNDWGKANKVDVTIDFITSIGNKLQLTGAAEARAGAGHDIICFSTWDGTFYKDKLGFKLRTRAKGFADFTSEHVALALWEIDHIANAIGISNKRAGPGVHRAVAAIELMRVMEQLRE